MGFSPMRLEHLLFFWSAQWLETGLQAFINDNVSKIFWSISKFDFLNTDRFLNISTGTPWGSMGEYLQDPA
jgi:hypothetical protein